MKNFVLSFAAVVGFAVFAALPAQAQANLTVVPSCGSPTYTSGYAYPGTQDTHGNMCGSNAGGGGGSVTITAPLGSQAQSASVATTGAVANAVAPTVVALSTTAGQVLAASANPVSRIVCNDDTAITEYFGPNTVTTAGANGIKLLPNQCWDFSHNTAAIFGVSASATPNARVVQY